MSILNADVFNPKFLAQNTITNDPKEIMEKNYWLGPDKKVGSFTLDLGCETRVSMVEIVNTHNAQYKDRSTKEFKVLVSKNENGSWDEVVHKTLEDSRFLPDPLPLKKFSFAEHIIKYVKFEILSFYGNGGGLQYFHVKGRNAHTKKFSKTFLFRFKMSETQEAKL